MAAHADYYFLRPLNTVPPGPGPPRSGFVVLARAARARIGPGGPGPTLTKNEICYGTKSSKTIGMTAICGQRETRSPNAYKPCRFRRILGTLLPKGTKRDQKPIRIYSVSTCIFTTCGNHGKPLGKHGFAKAWIRVQETL